MAYIIFVNPQIMAAAGMDKGTVMLATCLAAAAGTLLVRGKGRVSPAGSYRKGAAVAGKVFNGLHIDGRYPQIGPIEGVVKIADQQHAVKLAQISQTFLISDQPL